MPIVESVTKSRWKQYGMLILGLLIGLGVMYASMSYAMVEDDLREVKEDYNVCLNNLTDQEKQAAEKVKAAELKS